MVYNFIFTLSHRQKLCLKVIIYVDEKPAFLKGIDSQKG